MTIMLNPNMTIMSNQSMTIMLNRMLKIFKEVEKKYSDHFDKDVHAIEKNKDGGSRDEEKNEMQQGGDHKIVNSE